MKPGRELLASLLFIAIGAGGLVLAHGYAIGGSASMGPGYFPTMLSGALILLGAIGARQAVFAQQATPTGPVPWRPLLLVPLSVICFALLLERAGLAPASFVAALLAALAAARVQFWQALAGSVLLALLTSVVFIKLLGLPVTIGPPDW